MYLYPGTTIIIIYGLKAHFVIHPSSRWSLHLKRLAPRHFIQCISPVRMSFMEKTNRIIREYKASSVILRYNKGIAKILDGPTIIIYIYLLGLRLAFHFYPWTMVFRIWAILIITWYDRQLSSKKVAKWLQLSE